MPTHLAHAIPPVSLAFRGIVVLLVLTLLFPARSSAATAEAPPLPPSGALATTPPNIPLSLRHAPAHQRESRTVRVGWFDLSGIFERKNNVMTGYVAALLQALSQYTGWRHEWVHVNFRDLPRLLANGDIDISCGVSYIPSRTEVFSYSRLPAGYEAVTLHALENAPFYYMDLKNFEGMRVGTLRGSYGNAMLDRFARQYHLTLRKREYATKREAVAALRRKELDAYVDGSLFGEGMKIIALITLEPFFFVAHKDNTALLSQLDDAMRQLHIASPRLYANLTEDYLRGKNAAFSLTREEHDWLQEKPHLRIAYSTRQIMMQPSQSGSNFLSQLLATLSRRSGIAFDYVPAPTYEDALALIAQGRADAISDVYAGPDFSARHGLVTSTPYYDPPILLAGLEKGVPGSGLRIGVAREMTAVGAAYLAAYPADQLLPFPSLDGCKNARASGEIDAYIPCYPGTAFSVDDLPSLPFVTRARYSMALGLSSGASPLALSVLDKNISALTASEMEAMLMDRTPPSLLEALLRAARDYAPLLALLAAVVLALLVLRFIRHNRRHMLTLTEAAYRDPITGGDNRAKFLLEADACLKTAQKPYYLVLVNLRRLKLINRTRSHAVGDMLIRLCHEELLRHSKGPGELVGHASAGKFLLLWQCDDDEAFRARMDAFFASAGKLRRALDRAVVFSCGAYAVRHYDGHMANCLLLAETAESSLASEDYHSRCALYDAAMEARLLRDNELENRMVQALRNNEFVVYVQPQIRLSDNSLYGAEALVRWVPGHTSPIFPDEFIALFEKNGFIKEVDIFVLRTVCAWMRRRLDEGSPVTRISINQSKALFFASDYVDVFSATLREFNIPPHLIEVEITESMALQDEAQFRESVAGLRRSGISLALDDFGKGYASLSSLQSLDMDVIKIDKAFLDNISSDDKATHVIIDSIISMGKRLQLTMLCEGVENAAQMEYLRDIGCDIGQGYFIAKPMPLEDFSAYVSTYPAAGSPAAPSAPSAPAAPSGERPA